MKIEFSGVKDEKMQKEIETSLVDTMKLFYASSEGQDYGKTLHRHKLNVILSSRMRTYGGWATGHINEIKLNYKLLKDNPSELIGTFIHELAHILIFHIHQYDVRPHGKEWKALMVSLNSDPSRCHNMDTSKMRRRQRRFSYGCGCRTFNLSATKANRIEKGRNYWCLKCKKDLIKIKE